jgi:hypothetical protein
MRRHCGLDPAFIPFAKIDGYAAFQPDRRSQDQHLDGVLLQPDGCAVRRRDGMQFDVFGFAFLYLLTLGFYVLEWAFSWKLTSSIRVATPITSGSGVR